MSFIDADYDFLTLAKSQSKQSTSLAHRREPIERFASLVNTEIPKFEGKRQETLKQNMQAVSLLCEANNASLDAFYKRKVETMDSILTSQEESRDNYVPRANLKEFDDKQHLDMALAPWHFQNMPGSKASQWPKGLSEFVERLDSLP